ncbi:glycosyltransferase [Buttiauxella ferragutiae ATCC 51602]|uniref:Glycosyltransferase n=1 Tax=Buttiauxella ferragutiae ATCC 51602 TaxID=1354252 RepID=A0ABX2W7G8_9ENTR|nr:glycosyltransferase [Buttiauxella ferragutiae]OAT27049.1 glycosyltransferase [Buttiauxella ferragutiae ATCC 51602]
MTNSKNALIVSVCVITYNSSSTVIETLNSILCQTYGTTFIELIISDDASTDDTPLLIKEWLNENAGEFHNIALNVQAINSGITKNCNAAWKLCSGEWIKTIAGDDILESNCILDNINYVHDKNIKSVLFSKMQAFSVNEDSSFRKVAILPSLYQQNILKNNREQQYKYLLRAEGFSVAPSAFINRDLLTRLNFADERFLMIEDYPLWMKILESGEQCYFLDKITVNYRVGQSVSYSQDTLFSIKHIMQRFMIDLEINRNKLTILIKLRKALSFMIILIVYLFFGNKKRKINYILYYIGMVIKPYWLIEKLSKFIKE